MEGLCEVLYWALAGEWGGCHSAGWPIKRYLHYLQFVFICISGVVSYCICDSRILGTVLTWESPCLFQISCTIIWLLLIPTVDASRSDNGLLQACLETTSTSIASMNHLLYLCPILKSFCDLIAHQWEGIWYKIFIKQSQAPALSTCTPMVLLESLDHYFWYISSNKSPFKVVRVIFLLNTRCHVCS